MKKILIFLLLIKYVCCLLPNAIFGKFNKEQSLLLARKTALPNDKYTCFKI